MKSLVALLKDLFVNDDIVSAVSGTEVEPPFFDKDRKQRSQIYTTLGYFALIMAMMVLSSIIPDPPEEEEWDPPGLIFTMEPGPGGGGGGGDGSDEPLSVQEIAGEDEAEVAVKVEVPEDELVFDDPDVENIEEEEDEEVEPEDDTPEIVAPVVAQAPDSENALGALEGVTGVAANAGSGTGGGIGEGDGSGLGPGTGGGFGGGAYRIGSGVESPQLVHQTRPDFTDEAVLKKIQGSVVLEVVILEEGKVGAVRVLQGLPAGLNDQAIQCVRAWRFIPGKLKGKPVAVIAEISIDFTLL